MRKILFPQVLDGDLVFFRSFHQKYFHTIQTLKSSVVKNIFSNYGAEALVQQLDLGFGTIKDCKLNNFFVSAGSFY